MDQSVSSSIMVIGSDLHFCYLMRRYVRESEHHLLFSSMDDKAVELALREKPALIVLEAGLPNTHFGQILTALKSNNGTCSIPIALCSWQETDQREPGDGAEIHLRMPILYSDFLDILSRLGI